MSSSRMSMRISTGESGMRVLPEMFKHRVLQLAEETVDSLQIIWKEAGYEEIECQGLLGELLHKLKQTCALNLAAEQQILEHAKVEFGSKLDEYDNLCIQLGRLPAAEHLEERNYADKLAELEKMISEIMVEVSERQKLLNAELSVIKTLVDQLGETFPEMSQFSGPEGTPELSDVRVKLLKDYKNELENIKTRRIEKVKEAVNECGTHMKDLVLAEEGIATMSDYEQYKECDNQINRFLSKGEFSFGLTKQDMSVINNRLKSFIDEKDRRREELAKTGAEIARLWTLLRIPTVEREQFQSSFKMNLSMETLAKGHDELKRLKEIRTKSLGRVVTSIRSDILTLWEEAGIESEDQRRREFPMYYEEIEQLEDSSVDVHEAYFKALRARVDELKPILQKIVRREAVVQERIELEHIQLNPERLTARGPNAREERKREESMSNRVKNLEKLTKETVAQIQQWEEQNGPFMYGGERYFDRIAHQEESYIEIRDSLRNARRKKDGKPEILTTISRTTSVKKATGMTPSHSGHSSVHGTPATKGEIKINDINVSILSQNSTNISMSTPSGKIVKTVRGMKSNNQTTAINNENWGENRSSSGSNHSDNTQHTSMTEIQERTSSATIIRSNQNNR